MTGEEFLIVHRNIALRQRIVDLIKAFTRDIGQRTHLLCKAWMNISETRYGMTDEFYLKTAYITMRREWEAYLMPEPKRGRRVASDPGTRRATYVLRKMS